MHEEQNPRYRHSYARRSPTAETKPQNSNGRLNFQKPDCGALSLSLSPRRVEESVAAQVPADLLDIVLLRLELLPQARRVDVLVALVPPPVHHFCHRRVVARALESRHVGTPLRRLGARRRRRQRVVPVVVGAGRGLWLRGLVGVVEDAGALGAERLVDSEEVEVIVLDRHVNNIL